MTSLKRLKYLLATSLLVISNLALAHPGHDHSHWSSDAVHVLFYGVAALTAAAGVVWFMKSRNKTSDKEGEQ